MKESTILPTIIISIAIFLIIIFTSILMLNYMGDRFMSDCEKQNYQGIKSYWDLDIDCSQIHNIPNSTIMNNSMEEIKTMEKEE